MDEMWKVKGATTKIRKFVPIGLQLFCLMIRESVAGLTQEKPKTQKIDATAMGTSTQLGKTIQVTLCIYDYSREDDRQILIEAFEKGKNQGLFNALEKMKAVGRIAISGTLGYDVSYIPLIPSPTGRKIRFTPNCLFRFGENYYSTRTVDCNLTGGEHDLNDKDKQLSLDLNQNPWKLVNIVDCATK